MRISDYTYQMTANSRQSQRLEEECQHLKKQMNRLLEAEAKNIDNYRSHQSQISKENGRCKQVGELARMRLALSCSEDMKGIIMSQRLSDSENHYQQISRNLIRQIEEIEARIRVNVRQMEALQDQNRSLRSKINRLEVDQGRFGGW